jgi:hypothetical protein
MAEQKAAVKVAPSPSSASARPSTNVVTAAAAASIISPSLSLTVTYEGKKYPIVIAALTASNSTTTIRRVGAIVDAVRKATSLPLVDHVVYIGDSEDALDGQSSIDDVKLTSSTPIRVAPPITSPFGAALFSKLNEPGWLLHSSLSLSFVCIMYAMPHLMLGGVEYLYQRIDALNNKLRAIDASGKVSCDLSLAHYAS